MVRCQEGLAGVVVFILTLNGECWNLSRWEMEGVKCACVRACVCVCVELFSLQVPNWKIVYYVCTLAKREEKIKEATMS